MDFQHSQPQSVYRSKDRFMSILASAMLTCVVGFLVYNFLREPGFLTIIPIPIWLWWAYGLAKNALRNRIIMSPAGISVTFGSGAFTPWSNVERIQVITVGTRIKLGAVPCLVLREPAAGDMTPITRGVPDALKGRILPLYPMLWERIAELEQELYRYLPSSHDGGLLSVPHNFAAINARQNRLARQILITLAIVLGSGVLWLLRGIIW